MVLRLGFRVCFMVLRLGFRVCFMILRLGFRVCFMRWNFKFALLLNERRSIRGRPFYIAVTEPELEPHGGCY